MKNRKSDEIRRQLINSGVSEDIADFVGDQLRFSQLEEETMNLQQKLLQKSINLEQRLISLFKVLSVFPGLNHTIPTTYKIHRGDIDDNLDLTIKILRSEQTSHVLFLWKTHNIHKYPTQLKSFHLGDLNIEKRDFEFTETQIPLFSAMISMKQAAESHSLFKKDHNDQKSEQYEFKINRSWIENKRIGSDAVLDSSFNDTFSFLNFISDNSSYSEYKLVITLLAGVSEQISFYLDKKNDLLDMMNW